MEVIWTKAYGDKCASDGCKSKAQWHMLAGDVGSDYCDQCHDRIEDHLDPDDHSDEGYCDRCGNTGELDCHCGGDLCVCTNYGTKPCPYCT